MADEVAIEGNKVKRRFTPEWAASGTFDVGTLPRIVGAVVAQRAGMVEYIGALRDMIDQMLEVGKAARAVLQNNGGPVDSLDGPDTHVMVRIEDFRALEAAYKRAPST